MYTFCVCIQKVWVCKRRYAPSFLILLHSTATNVPCQGAATWVSDLSHCGVALFDDKRVPETLHSSGVIKCCRGAAKLPQICLGLWPRLSQADVFFFSPDSHLIFFSACSPPRPTFFFHLSGLTLCPLLSPTKWIHAFIHCIQKQKTLRHKLMHAGLFFLKLSALCLFFLLQFLGCYLFSSPEITLHLTSIYLYWLQTWFAPLNNDLWTATLK